MSKVEKTDIASRANIELFVNSFYNKVTQDKAIGFFFTEVVILDWEKHIPIMYDFWESILFQKAGYKGNPMVKHTDLSKKHTLEKQHFDQWLKLFNETLDDHFQGNNTELAKTRALSIATMIQVKIANG